MRARGTSLGLLGSLAIFQFVLAPAAAQTLADWQTRFDQETNSVRKAKMLEKLGDAQFEEARRAGKAGDHGTVALTLEKYRDNARAAMEALKKEHPDGEKHSNGYRQLEFHVRKSIREVNESLLVAPDEYKPPLEIVRQDLSAIDDELLRALFPHRPLNTPPTPKPTPPEKRS